MSSQTVFVDGASGFNATWEIQTHLQRGFDVVVSVRSPSKGEFLQSVFGPTYGRKFSYIIAPRRRSSMDSDTTSEESTSSASSSSPSSPVGEESTRRDLWVSHMTPIM